MSQDERTSQPDSDIGEESAAEKVQDSISGTDASAEGPIEGICTVDKAKTTPAGAVGNFDEDAGKTRSTELEDNRSAVMQEAVNFSRTILKSVTKYMNVIQESAAKLSSVIQESEGKLSGVIHESAAKLSNAAEHPDEVRNIIQASTRLSSAFLEARAETLRVHKKLVPEFFTDIYIITTEFFSAIQDLNESWNSSQESRAEILRAVQEATEEISRPVQDAATAALFSAVQETTVAFLIAAFQGRKKESHVVHEAADVSSPFQEAAAEASHVIQEPGTENAAAEREDDRSLSQPPDTLNSTLATSVPTVESDIQYKSSEDSSPTELL